MKFKYTISLISLIFLLLAPKAFALITESELEKLDKFSPKGCRDASIKNLYLESCTNGNYASEINSLIVCDDGSRHSIEIKACSTIFLDGKEITSNISKGLLNIENLNITLVSFTLFSILGVTFLINFFRKKVKSRK